MALVSAGSLYIRTMYFIASIVSYGSPDLPDTGPPQL
jgi:hypothetical protein